MEASVSTSQRNLTTPSCSSERLLNSKELEDKGRNVATNLAAHTGKSRKNINTRLPVLQDYGLVRKIGPAERSGLYEITPLGKATLVYQDQYDEVDDFEGLIEGPTAARSDPTVLDGWYGARQELIGSEAGRPRIPIFLE